MTSDERSRNREPPRSPPRRTRIFVTFRDPAPPVHFVTFERHVIGVLRWRNIRPIDASPVSIDAERVTQAKRARLCTLLSSFAQGSFEGDVEIASHLRHALIAVLAKEGRRLVILKNALTLLVLKQNHPERRVESGGELIAGHF